MLVGTDPFNDGTLLETAGQRVWVIPRGLENGGDIAWLAESGRSLAGGSKEMAVTGRTDLRLLCSLQ